MTDDDKPIHSFRWISGEEVTDIVSRTYGNFCEANREEPEGVPDVPCSERENLTPVTIDGHEMWLCPKHRERRAEVEKDGRRVISTPPLRDANDDVDISVAYMQNAGATLDHRDIVSTFLAKFAEDTKTLEKDAMLVAAIYRLAFGHSFPR